ncbi:phage major capsid protein, partial [Acetivibrio ethanolgignens]|uniref:phage major capsid protein n=1 Tax=Acetivibrio ethanolgignens TaxID=290052 RepID=UPI0011C8311E
VNGYKFFKINAKSFYSSKLAFGDFSYYWILNRRPLAVRALKEKFELYDQTGYLGMEYIDGKLVNREAIKVMQIS